MKRVHRLIFFIAWIWSLPLLPQMKPTFQIQGDGVGYVLLNDVVVMFENLAPGIEDWRSKVFATMNGIYKESGLARKQGKIDDHFYERFERILQVIKLVLVTDKDVEDPLLDAMIIREVNKFSIPTKMTLGKRVQGMGSVAAALTEELLSLKKYLDDIKSQKPN